MSRQKCISVSNALIKKLNALSTSNFIIKEIKGQTMISNKQNVENEAVKVVFKLLKIMLIEKFKLKIKPTVTII